MPLVKVMLPLCNPAVAALIRTYREAWVAIPVLAMVAVAPKEVLSVEISKLAGALTLMLLVKAKPVTSTYWDKEPCPIMPINVKLSGLTAKEASETSMIAKLSIKR